MIRRIILVAALAPGLALAAGSDDDAPTGTKTSSDCSGGMVWDDKSKACVAPKESRLNDDLRYEAVRELAWAGLLEEAQIVLSAMDNPNDDRVLTYWGFTHRKLGDVDMGMKFYRKALVQNPDNLLARSYMGQALVEAGDTSGARLQLAEIQIRGGSGTWAERSLVDAIRTGKGANY